MKRKGGVRERGRRGIRREEKRREYETLEIIE